MDASLELFDPRNGGVALEIEPLDGSAGPPRSKRFNYFTVYWIQEGEGTFWADLGCHPFRRGSLLFFTPFQASFATAWRRD